MWTFLMVILVLITFGLLVDWRSKRNRNLHQEAINLNAKSAESLNYAMEGDRNSPSGYL